MKRTLLALLFVFAAACGGTENEPLDTTNDELQAADAAAAERCGGGSYRIGCSGVCEMMWAVVDASDCSYNWDSFYSSECC